MLCLHSSRGQRFVVNIKRTAATEHCGASLAPPPPRQPFYDCRMNVLKVANLIFFHAYIGFAADDLRWRLAIWTRIRILFTRAHTHTYSLAKLFASILIKKYHCYGDFSLACVVNVPLNEERAHFRACVFFVYGRKWCVLIK